MKSYFDLVFYIGAVADEALATAMQPAGEDAAKLFTFDAYLLIRGINALKSVRVLCEEGQWEFATAAVRQLFELVLNMEHMATFSDRADGIARYTKFGLMQQLERQHAVLLYGKKTGRSVDEEHLVKLEQMLRDLFPEFRSVSERGRLQVQPYWSGHNVWALAKRSSHRLRQDQYRLLFSPWSEESHAAPGALMESMLAREVDQEQMIASDSARIAETLTMAVTLFLELWALLPNIPQANHEQRLQWSASTKDEARKYGVWTTAPHLRKFDIPAPASGPTATSQN